MRLTREGSPLREGPIHEGWIIKSGKVSVRAPLEREVRKREVLRHHLDAVAPGARELQSCPSSASANEQRVDGRCRADYRRDDNGHASWVGPHSTIGGNHVDEVVPSTVEGSLPAPTSGEDRYEGTLFER